MLVQNSNFNLCQIQLSAMLGGVMKLKRVEQLLRLFLSEVFHSHVGKMGVEIMHYQMDFSGVAIASLQQLGDKVNSH